MHIHNYVFIFKNLCLQVDTAQLENELLLRAISASEDTALSRPASDFKKRNAQLSKLGTIATVSVQVGAILSHQPASGLRFHRQQNPVNIQSRTSLNTLCTYIVSAH